MASLTVTPEQPIEYEYVLTLNREEAQVLLNLYGAIGGHLYEVIRQDTFSSDEWEHQNFVEDLGADGACVSIGAIYDVLVKAPGLKRYDGKVNR